MLQNQTLLTAAWVHLGACRPDPTTPLSVSLRQAAPIKIQTYALEIINLPQAHQSNILVLYRSRRKWRALTPIAR